MTSVWSQPGFQSIDYSDGAETEQRLQHIIDTASDISSLSLELRQHCVDWPTTYHLSGLRANILRPFEITAKHDVLEIGAGCGALSRYLGECGASVLALEGSLRRARIARLRTRDLDNVTVVAEKLSKFEPPQQFDVVTLIGVLEYASLDDDADDPAQVMLRKAASMLKPDGIVILAIENQLGLKYFAGAPEDHIGRPMYGVEGRYEKTQPRTYGRQDLVHLLSTAGLNVTSFMAPFPDYKLPVSIVTEAGFCSDGFDASVFAWQSVRKDPQLPALLGFAPERVWPEVIRNGLGIDLANSFLIVGTHVPSALPESQVLAWHYSADRAPQYCREARFSGETINEVTVSYRRLCPGSGSGKTDSALVRFDCPQNVRYSPGRLLSQQFIDLMGSDGWSTESAGWGFVRHYAAVLETLCNGEGDTRVITSITDRLPGKYLDVIPQNIILQDVDTPVIIDNEWRLTTDVEFGHCVLRALLLLMAAITRFGIPANGRTYTRQAFIEAVFADSGFKITASDVTRYIALEANIQAQITGRLRDEFLDWSPADLLMMQSIQSSVSEQLAELNRLQGIAEAQRTEVQMIRKSTSWKITAPLRRLSRALRGGKSTATRSQD
ncbi:MAG: class I SAM-dependent methyltransferase [Arenicellales bacterium]